MMKMRVMCIFVTVGIVITIYGINKQVTAPETIRYLQVHDIDTLSHFKFSRVRKICIPV